MPKQYFYPASRAHHALSMAIDHGFKYVNRDGTFWSLEGIAAFDSTLNYKFIVAPECALLIHPQSGDKVSYAYRPREDTGVAWDEVKATIFSNDESYPYTGNGEPYVIVDGCDEFPLSRLHDIFQRNGKPFMMPDCEEV